jgi:uncharacterized protein YlbG (UPF0298 family)
MQSVETTAISVQQIISYGEVEFVCRCVGHPVLYVQNEMSEQIRGSERISAAQTVQIMMIIITSI